MSKQNVAFDPKVQSSVPLAQLGHVHIDEQGRHWIYGISNGGTSAGYMCDMTTDDTYDFTSTTTTRCGTPGTHWKFLGVPDIDMTDNYYGWYWIGWGTFECIIENAYSSSAAADTVYTTGNAGIPGTNSSSHIIDGFKTVEAGVTATRITCWAARRLTAGICAAHD